MRRVMIIAGLAGLLLTGRAGAAASTCTVCGNRSERAVYFVPDKVAGDRKRVCEKCAALATVCYLCGLPARENFTELSDGRILCARDVKNVVLDEDEAQKIWREVQAGLARQFSRFISFPENVTLQPLDRVDLAAMFRVPGHDLNCPNVWGCTRSRTNEQGVSYTISLLRGLPPGAFKSTTVHELTHAWIAEHVPPARRFRLESDAIEGFCELVAFLHADAENEAEQKKIIQQNQYTRGQFALFHEAHRQYGFNDVVDWMKYGVDSRLTDEDLGRVRSVELPTATVEPSPAPLAAPAAAVPPADPETLTLKGIIWSKSRPMAVINDRTFGPQEEGSVRLGGTNVTLRCLAIREDAVVVRLVGSDEEQTLKIKGGR